MLRKSALTIWLLLFVVCSRSPAQHTHHGTKTAPPKIFLDKSPKVVEYQLSRLSNEQLLLIETDPNEPKFKPVFSAILTREGMDKSSRTAALNGLSAIGKQAKDTLLVDTLLGLKKKDSSYARIVKPLAELLIEALPESNDAVRGSALRLIGTQAELSEVGYAALASRDVSSAKKMADENGQLEYFFRCISLIPGAKSRTAVGRYALEQLGDASGAVEIRRSALAALESLSGSDPDLLSQVFAVVAKIVEEEPLQTDAVRTLLATLPPAPNKQIGLSLCQWIVAKAEASSPETRATEAFLDLVQLADKLFPNIDAIQSKNLRDRLSKTTVRIVRIKTVEEQMRYDTPFFAVQAGSELQIVLSNLDIMPHNLVIVKPGELKEVALLSATAGPEVGASGKQYVAQDDRVLFATQMIPAFEQERLTIKVPNQPGEYPYVCTFPGHWMRMYGVMVVVEDLDDWLQNPVKPKDPVGNNRQFVKNWTVDDFASTLETDLRGRSPEIGKRLFGEATCGTCHKAGTEYQIGNIGPELTETVAKWKGDRARVLREILEPSFYVDPAFAMHVVLTDSGTTISGVLVEENEKSISLLESVQSKKPTVIERDTIEAHQKSNNSMMPKGLLDQFSRDEVLEILAFLLSVQKP